MVYPLEEKKRMDALLRAFHPYVAAHEHYDILYSEKAGYLRVITEEGCEEIFFRIKDFDDMLRMFVSDHLQDEENRTGSNLLTDYDRVRNLLTPSLLTLGGDTEYALQRMERQFEDTKLGREMFRQERLKMIRELEEMLEELRLSV